MRNICLLLLLVSLPAAAVDITHCTVERHGGRWHATLDADIDASAARVFAAITDYDNLHTINPSIRHSRVMDDAVPGGRRVEMVVRVCILIFCKEVQRVQDVYHDDDTTVRAVMVGGAGDFSSGTATWRVTASGAVSRLQYREEFVPDFWVPPVIGPWLIKRKLLEEVSVTADYLERETGE